MIKTPVPPDEDARLAALRSLNILDTPAEDRFDRITKMAQHIFSVPFVTLSLIDGNRIWLKSRVGIEAGEWPRGVSFCDHAMIADGMLLIPDAKKDPRFADNPVVTGKPYIRFYAGYPLSNAAGLRMGAFCIKDTKPRELTEEEKKMLEGLAAWAELEINLLQSGRMASIGQLAAGAAREINDPMGFISSNMEILGQYVSDYGKVLEMANHLKESVQEENMPKARSIAGEIARLGKEINLDYMMNDVEGLLADNQKGLERIQKIVTNLRAFAREDHGNLELVKIEDIIEAVLTVLQGEIKHQVEFKKNYADTPFIQCNPQEFGQVFINLFLNAMQAVEEKGVIEVTTCRCNDNVRVDIRNTGKQAQGRGPGLNLSHEIVKKHGGEITAQSKAGEGTTITVLLPVSEQDYAR